MQRQLDIFHAQVENIHQLEHAWKHVNRQLNALLRGRNFVGASALTKVLGVIYCATAEAVFLRLIHTPNGLRPSEIKDILGAVSRYGITEGWNKTIEVSLRRVKGGQSNHKPNARKRLESLIKQHITDPSLIRNKLAHGQWKIALNRENTSVNAEITDAIEKLSVVDLYRRYRALNQIAQVVHDIVQSPNKAHWRDYWLHVEAIEAEQARMANWTLEDKLAKLEIKASRFSRKVG